jgi:hypothetical protein
MDLRQVEYEVVDCIHMVYGKGAKCWPFVNSNESLFP